MYIIYKIYINNNYIIIMYIMYEIYGNNTLYVYVFNI